MIRNNVNEKGNEMSKIRLNNNGTVAGIEVVKLGFRRFVAKFEGKIIEGTQWHNETGSKMEANKILKEMK
jgi:nicotinate-nucleotide pyrophosphorylase